MRSMRVWRLSFLLLFVVIVYGAYSVIVDSLGGAQEQIKAETDPGKLPFIQLRDERDRLEKEIRAGEIGGNILEDQKFWLNEEGILLKKLGEAKRRKDPPATKEELTKLEEEIKQNRIKAGTRDTLEQVNQNIKKNKEELKNKKDRKEKIETEINRKIDIEAPKQDFKKKLSYTFAGLIGLMIGGFFVIAWRDDIVRREIFRGQAGIQFITLFSVVIAIILFGILGILEGKELAALLGGLSGYILGRVTTPSATPEPKTPVSSQAITSISPVEITVGATDTVKIVGHDLQLANSVKIVQGANEVLVSDITSNDLLITCKVTLDANQPKGKYDIIVTNTDGGVAKLPQAFIVK